MSSKVGMARLTGATEMNIFVRRIMEVRMAGFKLCFLYEQMVVSWILDIRDNAILFTFNFCFKAWFWVSDWNETKNALKNLSLICWVHKISQDNTSTWLGERNNNKKTTGIRTVVTILGSLNVEKEGKLVGTEEKGLQKWTEILRCLWSPYGYCNMLTVRVLIFVWLKTFLVKNAREQTPWVSCWICLCQVSSAVNITPTWKGLLELNEVMFLKAC